jgi:hypothetical protein
VKLPFPDVEKVTVPVGVDAPAPSASVTVAVQIEPCPAVTGETQLTAVLLGRLLTVMLAAALVLVRCTLLPP